MLKLFLRTSLSQIFFNFRNICVSVAVFRHILQNILQYITEDRDTYTYITETEKNLGECREGVGLRMCTILKK
jgi:hypothetical protein